MVGWGKGSNSAWLVGKEDCYLRGKIRKPCKASWKYTYPLYILMQYIVCIIVVANTRVCLTRCVWETIIKFLAETACFTFLSHHFVSWGKEMNFPYVHVYTYKFVQFSPWIYKPIVGRPDHINCFTSFDKRSNLHAFTYMYVISNMVLNVNKLRKPCLAPLKEGYTNSGKIKWQWKLVLLECLSPGSS